MKLLLRAPLLFLACLACPVPGLAQDADTPWPVVGQQGLVKQVVVPLGEAKDRVAYMRNIGLLCSADDRACFLNFYTNSSGAALAVPLPEAITNEPTAAYRRSKKQQGEFFRFSCRLPPDLQNCFQADGGIGSARPQSPPRRKLDG